MKDLKSCLHSSIGKKQWMAVTGLMLCGFLLLHLLGNLLLFKGYHNGFCPFNDYAHSLESMGIVLYIAEVILLLTFIVHVSLAIRLTIENRRARGTQKYHVQANSGDLTLASQSMIYTGLWVLVFLVLHLIHFKFAERPVDKGLYGLVEHHFQSPFNVAYYLVTFMLLGAHLYHGVQSIFQTFGLNHKKYNALVKKLSALYVLVIVTGYSAIPLWFILNKEMHK